MAWATVLGDPPTPELQIVLLVLVTLIVATSPLGGYIVILF